MSYPNIRSLFDNMTDEEFENYLLNMALNLKK